MILAFNGLECPGDKHIQGQQVIDINNQTKTHHWGTTTVTAVNISH